MNRRWSALGYPWNVRQGLSRRCRQRPLSEEAEGLPRHAPRIEVRHGRRGPDPGRTLDARRVDELPSIRKEFANGTASLVLTGDSNFADPNTPQGKRWACSKRCGQPKTVASRRTTSLRGKRGCRRQKTLARRPAPFGYRLQSVNEDGHGREEVDYPNY